MAALYNDVRYACRALAASPGFVALAVLCLGIGIGANTMMFTGVDSVLLEPPRFAAPERLLIVSEVHAAAPGIRQRVSLATYRDLQEAGIAAADLAGLRSATFSIGRDGEAEQRNGAFATANLFPVLGIVPTLGRGFVPADEAAGAEPVVLLSDELWRTDYGAAREVIGTTLAIDGRAHTIIGVLPSLLHARSPQNIREARLWVPLESTGTPARDDRSLAVIGRLADGMTRNSAAALFGSIADDLVAMHMERADWGVRVEPLGGTISNTSRSMLLLGMATVALVLLIACANVANLMLARATRRRHEFAVRIALGASGLRIGRQLLAEGFVLSVLGTALGLVIARWGRDWLLKTLATASQGVEVRMPINASVLAFAIGTTLLACLLCSAVPALHAARNSARATLGETGFGATASRGAKRMRHGLVVAQVAAALVLLVGAALLLRSFNNLMAVDGGIDTANTDGARTPLAVINERMAKQLWADADPLGRQFVIEALPGRPAVTVIGISRGIANWNQSDRPLPTAYIHFAALAAFPRWLLVRTNGSMPSSLAVIGDALRSVEPDVEVVGVVPMDEVSRSAFWRQEVFSSMLAVFAAAAVLLTVVGLYGVLAYLVRLREREIGIRIALGSGRGAVMRIVLGPGVKLVGAGTALGLIGADGLARLMRGLLFGVDVFDVALVGGVTVMLVGVALAACLAPAYRATHIDARTLLRE